MHAFIKAALLGAAFLLGLSGCAARNALSNTAEVAVWAGSHGFTPLELSSGSFRLVSYARRNSPSGDMLTVYIEGDGAPWRNPYQPPRDPTPIHPLAFTLAAADSSASVVYLARPCQYLTEHALQHCDSSYWTERRFSSEVIAAYDDVLTQLKSSFHFKRLRLVGYSGGGVIATLLAGKRRDVEFLVTVAAPLSVAEWVSVHTLSPLTGSLDPAAPELSLRLPPSVHFIGANDKIVPMQVVRAFTRLKGGSTVMFSGFDHTCCWARDWPLLLKYFPVQESLL